MDIIFDKSNFYPVFSNDINLAKREILVVSPFVSKKRTQQIVHELETALSKNVEITVITRQPGDFRNKDLTAWKEATKHLESNSIHLIYKPNIHQKFAITGQEIIWYGSINLPSYGSAGESIMRIERSKIARELISSVEKFNHIF